MWGRAALGTALPGSGCRKGGPQWLLRPGLCSLVPARRPWASSDPFLGQWLSGIRGGPWRRKGKREGRDVLRVPRWSPAACSGERAGRTASASPHEFQKLLGVLGVGAAGSGPGQGCTALCGSSCLRKPPGPAGG